MKKYAKVQVELIVQTEKIKSLLKQGFSKYAAFETLKENGEITCSKSSFYRFVNRYIKFEKVEIAPVITVVSANKEPSHKSSSFKLNFNNISK